MKILHITAAYKPAVIYGGPTMSVATLCEELSKAGVSVQVFTTTANGAQELAVDTAVQLNVDGVPVIYFTRITKDHTHFSPGLLKALWKKATEFDAIHIHAWWNLVSMLSCAIALARKVPVVVSPRGMLSAYSFNNKNIGAKRLIHKIMGESLLNKSHIHTTSNYESQAVINLVKPLSITALPNFVKLPNPGVIDQSTCGGVLKLLFFSRIEEKKGLDILLKALKFLTLTYHLTIAGDGEEEYINYLKTLTRGVEDKITWAGFYGADKFELLQQHHLLVLPSHDENFGNVVIESLGVGTAVLVSEAVGLAGYVRENNFGWICQTNAQSVSDTINNIGASGLAALTNIRQTAPAIVRNDFTGTALAQKYINFYQQLIKA
ncbi:XrtY-associated glycosyltransferase XYAG1 [Mucilaginibacter gilvus]|uniref:Glycosyltransferase n=1 Tax=Mucilaginibacter gilvus TaxID=2305909 RepID=A0A3S3V777_9SPHI|nr:glycosyltransferase [Mucilaginibacter gilvus]RWY57344.1 glycosyltransferase [Mucilaginibacter gilvus]